MSSDALKSDIAMRPELVVSGAPLPAIEPLLEIDIEPAIEPLLEPLLEPAVEPLLEPAIFEGIRRPLMSRTFEPIVVPAPVTELAVDAPGPPPAPPPGPPPQSLLYPIKMRSLNERVSPDEIVPNAPDVCPPPADVAAPILDGLPNPKARSLEDSRAPARFVGNYGTAVSRTYDETLTSADALKRSAPAALGFESIRAIEAKASTVQVAQQVDVMLNVRHEGDCLGVTIEKLASDAAVFRAFVCPAVNGACPTKRDASCHYVEMPIVDEGTLTM